MRVISLQQPWASLMAYGEKLNETRAQRFKLLDPTWQNQGPVWVAIHASNTWTMDQRQLLVTEPFKSALGRHGVTAGMATHQDLPRGAVAAVAQVIRVAKSDGFPVEQLTEQEQAFGNYGPDRWIYTTDPASIYRLRRPVLLTGRLGVWTVGPDLDAKILAEIQDYIHLPHVFRQVQAQQ